MHQLGVAKRAVESLELLLRGNVKYNYAKDLNTDQGRDIIGSNCFTEQWIEVIEVIISMEEFLKHGRITVGGLNYLPKIIIHFLNCMNSICLRKGTGNKLIKNHIFLSMSRFVQHGTLINKLYLFSVDTILSDVAVVPEMDLNGVATTEFLVVSN
eukprot:3965091-Ditylum_brightwellii.AAC.1